MRAITLVILLVFNLIALASILGWLGDPGEHGGEPQRLDQQLNPERIVLAGEQLAASDGEPESEQAVETVVSQDTEQNTEQDTEQNGKPDSEPGPTLNAEEAPVPDQDEKKAEQVPAIDEPAPEVTTVCLAWSGLGSEEARRLSSALRKTGVEPRSSSVDIPNSWWVHLPPQGGREQAERQAQNLRASGVRDLFIVQEAGPNQHAISLGVFKTEARARVLLNELRKQGVSQAVLSPRLSSSHRIEASFPAEAQAAVDSATRGFNAQRMRCNKE